MSGGGGAAAFRLGDAGGGGGGGSKTATAPAATAPAHKTVLGPNAARAAAAAADNFLRENLFLWCYRIDHWRWYMSPAVNRRVATLLVSAEVREAAVRRREEARDAARRAANWNPNKQPLNLYFDFLSGVRIAVLPKIDRHALVSKAKDRCMVKAMAKARATRTRKGSGGHVSTKRWQRPALRLFLKGEELLDDKTLWAQGVRDNEVITVLFAAADRDNLEALYNCTYGPFWGKSKHRHGWLKCCPISEWAGVTVDVTGDYVVSLDRYKLCLEGPLPLEIGRFSNITSLNLSHCKLSGPLRSELGQLRTLTDLDLSFNRLEGPIPKELADLHRAQSIDIQKNRLTGKVPRELVRLADLRRFNVSRNRLAMTQADQSFLQRQLPACLWVFQ